MSIKRNTKVRQWLYSAGALLLCIVLLLSLWISNKEKTPPVADPTTNPQTEVTEEIEVNIPVTNVPDEREDVTAPQVTSIIFEFPLKNRIIKAYSNGEIVRNTTTDDWRTHNAIDISGEKGEDVFAIYDGFVIDIVHHELWGTTVIIDHGNGFTAKYCGLDKNSIPELNEEVKSNEKIGVLGEIPIEKSDGVHLHFEMYRDGKNVSPIKYLGNEITV